MCYMRVQGVTIWGVNHLDVVNSGAQHDIYCYMRSLKLGRRRSAEERRHIHRRREFAMMRAP